MMKKQYMAPTAELVHVDMTSALMAGSGFAPGTGGPSNPGSGAVKKLDDDEIDLNDDETSLWLGSSKM